MVLVLSGAIVGAQKVTTPDELDKVMKKVGPAILLDRAQEGRCAEVQQGHAREDR
jgi:hypothetical protein